METLILLLFFALSDKNNDMKQTLNQFLGFYRENRELIQMLAGSFSNPHPEGVVAGMPPAESENGHKESRPREEVGNLNILEEYLRRANA